ncbi:MAG TPA: hypothetical protein VE665_02885, partial [Hyphomicrobiaceae bacterium]|nr:hypothetical protein [Hyphomicrobiaceae bacterium]
AAAAAQAAYEVLRSQYPKAQAKLEAALATSLERIATSPAKRAGIELGKATATAILARRNDDGFDAKGTYAFVTGPGLGRVETLLRGYQVVVVVDIWGFSTRTDAIDAGQPL